MLYNGTSYDFVTCLGNYLIAVPLFSKLTNAKVIRLGLSEQIIKNKEILYNINY